MTDHQKFKPGDRVAYSGAGPFVVTRLYVGSASLEWPDRSGSFIGGIKTTLLTPYQEPTCGHVQVEGRYHRTGRLCECPDELIAHDPVLVCHYTDAPAPCTHPGQVTRCSSCGEPVEGDA